MRYGEPYLVWGLGADVMIGADGADTVAYTSGSSSARPFSSQVYPGDHWQGVTVAPFICYDRWLHCNTRRTLKPSTASFRCLLRFATHSRK